MRLRRRIHDAYQMSLPPGEEVAKRPPETRISRRAYTRSFAVLQPCGDRRHKADRIPSNFANCLDRLFVLTGVSGYNSPELGLFGR